MDDEAAPPLLTTIPAAPVEEPPRHTLVEKAGEAVYEMTHHGHVPQDAPPPAPIIELPPVPIPAALAAPAVAQADVVESPPASHVAALVNERRVTTSEAIASALAANEATGHALRVAARAVQEDGQGRGI